MSGATPPSPPGAPSRPLPPAIGDLRDRLTQLTLADERRWGRRLAGLTQVGDRRTRDKRLREIADGIALAELNVERRRESVPAIRFPPDLPVGERAEDLAAAISAHQVVIVAGETGSGKSTQLPKICLQLGRGVRGLIGHTQPRRIAARALAERIAEETGTELGDAIGYTIRFGDHTGPNTLVKLMTDGILLAEIARDRSLSNYDTIIIDEAHERSLNIDFLLGYLTELLPRRPDLKLIITSATIDPERFSRHFGDAPIVEVSGRTFPVEVRYRPYGADGTGDADDLADPGPIRREAQASLAAGLPAPSRSTRRRRSAGRWTSCPPRAMATSWCSFPANGRSRTPRSCCADICSPGRESPTCSRCTGGCRLRTSTRCSPAIPGGGSCWPPTWRRPR